VPILAHPDDHNAMSEFVSPISLLGGSGGASSK
jgi:hypothetical protein